MVAGKEIKRVKKSYNLRLIERIVWCLQQDKFITDDFLRFSGMTMEGGSRFLAALRDGKVLRATVKHPYVGNPQVWRRNGIRIVVDLEDRCKHGLAKNTCVWCREK